MKRKLFLCGIFILNLACPLWAGDNPGTTEEFYVNGLKVILKQNTANEIISAQLYLRGGVLNTTQKNQGIEPFIFSSATLNDKKYRDESWTKVLEGTGAQLGAGSQKDFTVVSLQCAKQYFDDLWVVFSDYVLKNAFYDERVEVVRQRIISAIRRRKDTPDLYIRTLGEEKFYRDHPYELDPQGTVQSLGKITMRDMKSHLKDRLKKARLLLVVLGNVDKEVLRQKVSKTFAKLSKGKYKHQHPPMVEHSRPGVKIVEQELPTNYILGLFSAPSINDPDYYAMAIAVDILKWRLFEEVRTKRNLSYAPDAFLNASFANYGGIYATSVHPDSTLRIMLAEMKGLREEKLADKELKDRINMYLTRHYLNNESNAAQGQYLARYELSGLGWQETEHIVEKLRQVTVDDVQRVAKKFFKNLQFVYLGDPDLVTKELFTSSL